MRMPEWALGSQKLVLMFTFPVPVVSDILVEGGYLSVGELKTGMSQQQQDDFCATKASASRTTRPFAC
jgi:hypothetical protein